MNKIFVLFSVSLLPLLVSCAATSGEVAETPVAQPYYYDPASPDQNKGYFANVKDHFSQLGITIPDAELHDFTASRYITSSPPDADVYVGTRYMGRTNRGDLYFKPGQYTVDFSVNGDQWSEILSFVEGRNASLMVRKP